MLSGSDSATSESPPETGLVKSSTGPNRRSADSKNIIGSDETFTPANPLAPAGSPPEGIIPGFTNLFKTSGFPASNVQGDWYDPHGKKIGLVDQSGVAARIVDYRTKNPPERRREIEKGTDHDTGVDDENTDNGRKTKGKRGRVPKEWQVEVQTETATLPIAQVLQIIHSIAANYESKMEQHMKAYENKIEKYMKAYEDKIKELLEIGQKDADRIVALETQHRRMMELIKNSNVCS